MPGTRPSPLYDLVIVGAGLFGATFCNLALERGLRVLVIDKRRHIAGNCYSENVAGIEVHKYGPHIFHTADKATWEYARRFTRFLPFNLRVKACSKGEFYSFPVNLATIRALYPKVRDAAEAADLLASFGSADAAGNFEDYLIGRVGEKMYRAFYYGYSKKQWGREPRELPAFIAKRIPVRAEANDRYFDHAYEGIPEHGYTAMIRNMMRGAELRLETDYLRNKPLFDSLAGTVLYTGELDGYFDHRFGRLEYRSLRFEEIRLERERFQPTALVTYCDEDVPFTRITEHKHFTGVEAPHTIITREYPGQGRENLYPVNDAANNALCERYTALARAEAGVLFGGRLAEYRYFDMDHVIQSAMRKFRRFQENGYRKVQGEVPA